MYKDDVVLGSEGVDLDFLAVCLEFSCLWCDSACRIISNIRYPILDLSP